MLYPISNLFRDSVEVGSFWKFKTDEGGRGETQGWMNGFESDVEIAVPGSWNEQLEELGLLHYVGAAWYSKMVFLPKYFSGKRIWIRIGSADFSCKVWVNGAPAGSGEFGFLPNDFEITPLVTPGEKVLIVVRVSNELSDDSIPQGITAADYSDENRIREETNPPARFDFSPFGGIHRPVVLYSTPMTYIEKIRVDTEIADDNAGKIKVSVASDGPDTVSVSARLTDDGGNPVKGSVKKSDDNVVELTVAGCRFWSDRDPYLYNLTVYLDINGIPVDEYSLQIGVREIRLEGNKLLLNGRELFLKGFGKHEDFSVVGRGLLPPLVVKDFQMMKWINSNSFRTSHYPYSEEVLLYADRIGILVISEAPAVSLDLRRAGDSMLENHKNFIRKMVERDYNHPSVIIWSVGNEPNIVGESSYYNGSGRTYWKEIFETTRGLDGTRPITVPNCSRAGLDDPVFEFSDILSINRYYGWYEYPGNLDLAVKKLAAEMDELHRRYGKPVLVTEFGADSITGSHSNSCQMFTEEYQADLIEQYVRHIESTPYAIGEMVWNFADFRTPQHFRRVVLNLKGVFTRMREPKLAAFRLKEIWGRKKEAVVEK